MCANLGFIALFEFVSPQGYKPEEMFEVAPTAIRLSEAARLFDSYVCDCCGEITGANWIRLSGDKKRCLDCYESYDCFHILYKNSTAADHQVGGCFYLFGKLEFI